MSIPVAHDPVTAGEDASAAPLEQASPDASMTLGGTATVAKPPAAKAAEASPEPAAQEPDVIPTGFPEPAAPEEPRAAPADGMVRLAPVGFGSLMVPPLALGGEVIVITAEGTEVDEATAERAHEAARLAGFRLREV